MGRVFAVLLGFTALTGTAGASPNAVGDYGRISLGFEENRGQTDRRVAFLSRGNGYAVFAARRELVLALGAPGDAAVLRMRPIGAVRRTTPVGVGDLTRRTNYLGTTSVRNVRSYRRVVYPGLYPGIDLVLRGNQRALEYDFVVAPGASPRAISLAFRGAEHLAVDPSGQLVIETSAGTVRQHAPYVYQRVGGDRRQVPGRFVVKNSRVGFAVGSYDRSRPLVIDPVIEYATYLGGATSYEHAAALAVDASGSAYVAGLTFSADYPTTSGVFDAEGHGPTPCQPAEDPAFQPPPVDLCRSDAFVTKLSPDGSDLEYSTYLGGTKSDRVQDVAVDSRGAAYLTGGTDSTDFPTTTGALDTAAAGERRVMGAGLAILGESFLTKLSPDGSKLEYSTLLGGADAEEAMGINVDSGGNVYVAGMTFSSDYPTTQGAFDTALNAPDAPPNTCSDIFMTKIGPAGDALAYSTLVGGSRLDFAWELDIDETGAAYIMGESTANDAPTTPGAYQPTGHMKSGPENADCSDGLSQFDDADPLVVKVKPDGSGLAYSTYLGGSVHEHGLGIEVADGAAYVVGHTNSPDFPTTGGAFDREPKGTATLFDGFAAKLSPEGDRLEYSTLLGGSDDDWIVDVDLDDGGRAYLTGMTTSPDFPTSDDGLDRSYVGPGVPFYDAFVTRLSADGSRLDYSSYFGGAGPDVGLGIVTDGKGSAWLAGLTFSPDLPASANSPGSVFKGPAGYSDAFLAKFSDLDTRPGPRKRPSVRLSVKPKRARVGDRVRFRFRATRGGRSRRAPVDGATVRIGRRTARTNRRGRVTIPIRFRRQGRKVATARRAGFRTGRAVVRVRGAK